MDNSTFVPIWIVLGVIADLITVYSFYRKNHEKVIGWTYKEEYMGCPLSCHLLIIFIPLLAIGAYE